MGGVGEVGVQLVIEGKINVLDVLVEVLVEFVMVLVEVVSMGGWVGYVEMWCVFWVGKMVVVFDQVFVQVQVLFVRQCLFEVFKVVLDWFGVGDQFFYVLV